MIGRAIDRLIDTAIIAAAEAANEVLDRFWPMRFRDEVKRDPWMIGSEQLAEAEEGREVWEPDELWAAQHLSENPIYREIQLQHAREQGAAEDLLSKLADAQNEIHDFLTPTVKRPFQDTDDFAEPVGEHPDIDPAAVVGKRQQWDGIGGHPVPPAGGGESEAPAASRATNLAAVKRILDHSIDTYLDCGWESNYDAAYQVRILDHSIDTYPDCDWESNYDAAYQGWLTNTAAEILNALQK